MKLMFRLGSVAVAAALLMLPGAASAKDGGLAAGLEFQLGFADEITVDPDKGKEASFDANAMLGITPVIEKMAGSVLAFGMEWMFLWAKPEDTDKTPNQDRRLIMSPHFRVRMSFPLVSRLTFDGMLGVGPTIWTSQDDVRDAAGGGTRLGWSYRFAFGGSYGFNDSVAALVSLGYLSTTSYGDDQTMNLSSVPFTLGLRSRF